MKKYLIITLLIFNVAVIFGTDISGVIYSDTTLTKSNSPYRLTGDIIIAEGCTLTIEPGVKMVFDTYDRLDTGFSHHSYIEIMVYGSLYAVGTPDDTIIFTVTDTTYHYSYYCIILNSDTYSSSIEYCRFSSQGNALYIRNGDTLIIKNNTFFKNYYSISIDNNKESFYEINNNFFNECNRIINVRNDNNYSFSIKNNYFYYCDKIGFTKANLFKFHNNIFLSDILHYSSDIFDNYILRIDADSVYVYNNTFMLLYSSANSNYSYIFVGRHYSGQSFLDIYNNIFINGKYSVIYNSSFYYESDFNINIRYNCYWNMEKISNQNTFLSDNINQNPLLIDTNTFKLDKLSPCIQAGINRQDLGAVPYTGDLSGLPPRLNINVPTAMVFGDSMYFDASKSFDPNDDDLQFQWSELSNNPANNVITGDLSADSIFFYPNKTGVYQFFLTITDIEGLTVSESITIGVYNTDDGIVKYGILQNRQYWHDTIYVIGDIIAENDIKIYPDANIIFFPGCTENDYNNNNLCDIIINTKYVDLYAYGSAEYPIFFKSIRDDTNSTSAPLWGSILLNNSNYNNIDINYCIIEDAQYGIYFGNISNKYSSYKININNSEFKNNNIGIYGDNAVTNIDIENNKIFDNNTGINLSVSGKTAPTIILRNNYIYNNNLGFDNINNNVSIINNTFDNNGTGLYNGSEYQVQVHNYFHIINNNFTNNNLGVNELYCDNSFANNFYNNNRDYYFYSSGWEGDYPYQFFYKFNPNYIDVANYDFTLNENSPLKGIGLGHVDVGVSESNINVYSSKNIISFSEFDTQTTNVIKINSNDLLIQSSIILPGQTNNNCDRLELLSGAIDVNGYMNISHPEIINDMKKGLGLITDFDNYIPNIIDFEIYNDRYLPVELKDIGSSIYLRYYAKENLNNLYFFYYNKDEKVWQRIIDRTVSYSGGYIESEISHLSIYGVFPIDEEQYYLKINLNEVSVYPNPYRPNDNKNETGIDYENGNLSSGIVFINLTQTSQVWIYSISGELIINLDHNTGNGIIHWDTKDNNGNLVLSGYYLYVIKDDDQNIKKGKLAIIR